MKSDFRFSVISFLFVTSILSLPLSVLAAGSKEGCDKTGCLHWGDLDTASQSQLREWEAAVTSPELNWEYILVRINGASGLGKADMFNAADTLVSIKAVLTEEGMANLPEVKFYDDEKVNEYVFPVRDNTDNPKWYRLGMVTYLEGTAKELLVKLSDDEGYTGLMSDQVLFELPISIEDMPMNVWNNILLEKEPYALNISSYRSTNTIQTAADQNAMGLTEEILSLEDDNMALLNSKKISSSASDSGSSAAVLYIGGLGDSFAHPHVLELYEGKGYDFYTLDARYCGRTVHLLNDTQYGHWIHNFDTYREELDLAVEKIHQSSPSSSQKYESLLLHCHSTGCLVALNYLRQLKEEDSSNEPFDGYILNAPFLDWGEVGGWFYEFALENTDISGFIAGENSIQAEGLSLWNFKNWLLYQFSPTMVRTLIKLHLNNEWAKAVTEAQEKITSRKSPLTDQALFNIVSRGDDTLDPQETLDRLKFVSGNPVSVWLDHNAHDVTMSYAKELNNEALTEMGMWLDWFGSNKTNTSYTDSNKTVPVPTSAAAHSNYKQITWLVLLSLIPLSMLIG